MKKGIIIILLLLFGFILPQLSYSQDDLQIKSPENFEEARRLGEEALEASKKNLPGILKQIWREEVIPTWQEVYQWFSEHIVIKIKNWIDEQIRTRVEKEVEKRKPIIREEFKKEKEEMEESIKEDIPKAGKSFWDKIKEWLK